MKIRLFFSFNTPVSSKFDEEIFQKKNLMKKLYKSCGKLIKIVWHKMIYYAVLVVFL